MTQSAESCSVLVSVPQTTSKKKKTGRMFTCRRRSLLAWQLSQHEPQLCSRSQACSATNSKLQHGNHECTRWVGGWDPELTTLAASLCIWSDYLHIHHRGVTGVWVVCSHFQLELYYCQRGNSTNFIYSALLCLHQRARGDQTRIGCIVS